MLRWLIGRKLDAFERDYDYDVSYMREILDVGARPLMRFARATAMGACQEGVPLAARHAAKLAAIIHGDCGPCTQLCVTMAEREGVDPAIIRAVVRGDDAALPSDARLAVAFTRAALDRSPDADPLRDEVVARFGRAGLVTLAFVMTAAGMYPTMKYALGHGQACTQVRVQGEPVPRAVAAS